MIKGEMKHERRFASRTTNRKLLWRIEDRETMSPDYWKGWRNPVNTIDRVIKIKRN